MFKRLRNIFGTESTQPDPLQHSVDMGLRKIDTATDLERETFLVFIAETSHGERAQVAQDALSFMLRKVAFELEEGPSQIAQYLETHLQDIAPETLKALAASGDVYVRETLAKLVTQDNIAHAPEAIELLSQSCAETRQALHRKLEI